MTPTEIHDQLIRGFLPCDEKDVRRRDAWVIYKDGSPPKGLTRGQWMDRSGGFGPTEEQFARNSYAIHASLTGNDQLKVNGKYFEHDYMPPQVFLGHIKLSAALQEIVNDIPDDDLRKKTAYNFRVGVYHQIADNIGIPRDIPQFIGEYRPKELFQETIAGETLPWRMKYDNPIRAGTDIPNLQIWKGSELLEVAWHTKYGHGKYDRMSLGEAKAAASAAYGEGVEIALKSNTNCISGTARLDCLGADAASKRWAKQIGKFRDHHPLTVVMTTDGGTTSSSLDVMWLMTNARNHDLTKGLLRGEYGHHLRVGSGIGRFNIYKAMDLLPAETKKLLAEAGIPESIAAGNRKKYKDVEEVGERLPAVTVPLDALHDGPPEYGVDIMNFYRPDRIMIALRDRNGVRTGDLGALSEFAAAKLRLPDDAAKELGIESDIYSRAAEKPAIQYDGRSPNRDQCAGR